MRAFLISESLHGASLLHHAVEAGGIKCTRMLLENRMIDVNAADETGGSDSCLFASSCLFSLDLATPLHRAVAEGHTAVVKLLLENFAGEFRLSLQ